MIKIRLVPVLAALTALLAPPAVHSAAAQGPCEEGGVSQGEPFEACGRTTVVGPRGTTMRLHVPQETVLDLSTEVVVDPFLERPVSRFRTTVLKGEGPAQGFLLTDNLLPSDGGRYVYAVHLARGFYGPVQDYATGNFEQRGAGLFVVPPGDYSLYVISDGNPVTATLPFDGRPGHADYEPSRVVLVDFRVLENRLSGGTGQQNMWSAGQAGTFRRPGFHALTWAAVGELPDPASLSGWCYYYQRPQNEDTAYLPGCPNAVTEELDTASAFGPGVYPETPSQFFMSAFSGPGGRAMGAWRTDVKPLERINALSFFFELDPAFA
jgi:hypothetical protein